MKWSASLAVPCFTVTPDQVWICDWAAIAQSEWLQGVKMCHKAHGQHSIPDLVLLSHVPQVSSIITTKEPTASQSLLTIGKPFAAWDSFVIFFGGIKMKWTQRFSCFFFFYNFPCISSSCFSWVFFLWTGGKFRWFLAQNWKFTEYILLWLGLPGDGDNLNCWLWWCGGQDFPGTGLHHILHSRELGEEYF